MGERVMRGLFRAVLAGMLVAGLAAVSGFGVGEASAQARGGAGRGAGPAGPPPSAQNTATVDLTGYWVSLVTEDWHWRMSVPERGDVSSIPFTNDPEARALLEAWDPERDEAEGDQCKAYGAAAIMRVPTRVRISWQDPNTLRLETDAGMQRRLFHFGEAAEIGLGERTWQGFSVARWYQPPGAGGRGGFGGGRGAFGGGRGGPGLDGALFPDPPGPADDGGTPPPPAGGPPAGGGRGGPGPSAGGSLEVITTNLRSGYLRKNGVPYSENARVTEYFHRTDEEYGNTYMIVTTIVEDPEFLTTPFITSSHFKKLPDTDNGWNPTPCSVL